MELSKLLPILCPPGWPHAARCLSGPLVEGATNSPVVTYGTLEEGRARLLGSGKAEQLGYSLAQVHELAVNNLVAYRGDAEWMPTDVDVNGQDCTVLQLDGDVTTASGMLDAELMAPAHEYFDAETLYTAAPSRTTLLLGDSADAVRELARQLTRETTSHGGVVLNTGVLPVVAGQVVAPTAESAPAPTSQPAAAPGKTGGGKLKLSTGKGKKKLRTGGTTGGTSVVLKAAAKPAAASTSPKAENGPATPPKSPKRLMLAVGLLALLALGGGGTAWAMLWRHTPGTPQELYAKGLTIVQEMTFDSEEERAWATYMVPRLTHDYVKLGRGPYRTFLAKHLPRVIDEPDPAWVEEYAQHLGLQAIAAVAGDAPDPKAAEAIEARVEYTKKLMERAEKHDKAIAADVEKLVEQGEKLVGDLDLSKQEKAYVEAILPLLAWNCLRYRDAASFATFLQTQGPLAVEAPEIIQVGIYLEQIMEESKPGDDNFVYALKLMKRAFDRAALVRPQEWAGYAALLLMAGERQAALATVDKAVKNLSKEDAFMKALFEELRAGIESTPDN